MKFTRFIIGTLLTLSLTTLSGSSVFAAITTPRTIGYQGRLLNPSNVALTGSYDFRFSLWTDADYTSGVDDNGAGVINIADLTYAGWQETQTITVGSFGLFDLNIGSITPFPNFNKDTHKYLQVEVKKTTDPITAFEVLDPAGTLADTNDRKPLENQAYAENADTIDNTELSTIQSGTPVNNFTLDTDNTGGDVTLQFGALLNEYLKWNNALTQFELSDDLYIGGGLQATGNINFAGASQFHMREVADEATATCTTIKELVLDTTENKIYVCTAVGSPGTWVSSAPAADFEAVYTADAGQNLNTGNGAFTINTGTGDFVVSSNDWGVDAAGNATFGGTVNGVNLSSIPFSNLATRAKADHLPADFGGAVISADGTSNKGKIISDSEDTGGTNKRNYYEFTSQQGSLNDLDLVVTWMVPMDFTSFTASPIQFSYQTADGVAANNVLDATLYDTTGTAVAISGGSALANAAWTQTTLTWVGSPTFTPGQKLTLRIKLSALSGKYARIADLIFNYNGR